MAKEPAKPAATAAAKPQGKKKGKLGLITGLIIVGMATPFMMPTVLLVLAGLIPTYFAFFLDSDPQKSGAVSVGAMNVAGIVPFIIDLWAKGQTMPAASQILSDSHSWLIIWGASGVGHLIVYAIPQAIATLTLTQAESRMKSLQKNLVLLKEAWGPEVATTKPIDKIIQG
jgi:hypothetical protein